MTMMQVSKKIALLKVLYFLFSGNLKTVLWLPQRHLLDKAC